jgi:hypothetical protein
MKKPKKNNAEKIERPIYSFQKEDTSFPKFIRKEVLEDGYAWARADEAGFTQWIVAVEERIEALEKQRRREEPTDE